MWRRLGQGCLLCGVLLAQFASAEEELLPAPKPALGVPWTDYDLEHVANNEPIADLLREFASDQGLPIVISDKIEGTISGEFGPLPPREFLDEITTTNGLIWCYDGSALYVNRSDEIATEIIPVRGAQLEEVVQALEQLGVLSDRFPLRVLEERGLLYITGPPRYLEVVSQLASKIQQQAERQASVEVVIEVFPLRYAWADNQTFLLGGNQVIVPGVATLLQNLINGQQGGGGGPGGRIVQQLPYNLPSLRGSGLITPYNDSLAFAAQSARNAELAAAEARGRASALESEAARAARSDSPEAALAASVSPVIQADPRLNAIVIRDVRERMPGYRKIIEQLDHPSGLVQIEASIIDVDADSGFEWSPDALFEWLKTDPSASLEVSTFPLGTDDNPNIAFEIGSAGVFNLLTRFRALEVEGHARLVSRPTVLTINNVEATLNSQEEFFVRVNGFETSDLFNVSVGTVLRIIPHIVDEGSFRRIKLIVTVEDGRRTEDTVDTVPVISRNTINTQAVLNEGDSLLIGGLIREEATKQERRIPFLGQLPVVGHLMASTDTEKRRFERLVLITPKVINLPDLDCEFPEVLPGSVRTIVPEEGAPPPVVPAGGTDGDRASSRVVEHTSWSSEGKDDLADEAGESPGDDRRDDQPAAAETRGAAPRRRSYWPPFRLRPRFSD